MQLTPKQARNFFKKFTFGNADQCWNWHASKQEFGYGQFHFEQKILKAHRFSWEYFRGAIPVGLYVLHKCDNPRCINPNHLFLGTPFDNMQDKIRKGRAIYEQGEKSHNARLTDSQVKKIRDLYSTGKFLQIELGKQFGVTNQHIGRIVNFKARIGTAAA